jgi:hypothetical protein
MSMKIVMILLKLIAMSICSLVPQPHVKTVCKREWYSAGLGIRRYSTGIESGTRQAIESQNTSTMSTTCE